LAGPCDLEERDVIFETYVEDFSAKAIVNHTTSVSCRHANVWLADSQTRAIAAVSAGDSFETRAIEFLRNFKLLGAV